MATVTMIITTLAALSMAATAVRRVWVVLFRRITARIANA